MKISWKYGLSGLLLLSLACNKETVRADSVPPEEKRPEPVSPIIHSKAEVQAGQGLYQVLEALLIPDSISFRIINTLQEEVELTKLRVGEKMSVQFDSQSEKYVEFQYSPHPALIHKAVLDSSGYRYEKEEKPTQTKYRLLMGALSAGSSLDLELRNLGIPPGLIQNVNNALLAKISFRTSAREGDSFRVILEETYYEKHFIQGSALYASYQGRRTGEHKAFLYQEEDSKSSFNGHYTENGEHLSQSGLRYPMDRVHVVSGFGMRLHPVTGRRSMHYGVDYKGRTGEPVYAVSKGMVVESGYDGYSGNKIGIRHADNSISYYLHLSQRLVKKGQSVNTRQLIGRVGASGRVTGAHLHFAFKNSDKRWMNPLNKRMIASPKLVGDKLIALRSQVSKIQDLHQNLEGVPSMELARHEMKPEKPSL